MGFLNPFPSRGGARGQRPCPSASSRKREPPLSSRTQAQPPPAPTVPSTPQSGGGCRSAGEEAHLSAVAAEAEGSTEEGSSDPPRRLSAGAGGTQRRGPDRRFPELLLRSSVLTAVPGNQRPNCHSPPPSAPAVSASSSHSFLPPPAHPAPPRPAPACRPRAVRHGVTPSGSAAGGSGTLSFARARSAWRVLVCPACDRVFGRTAPRSSLTRSSQPPFLTLGKQHFAPSGRGCGAGVASEGGWGGRSCSGRGGRCWT